MGYVTLKNTPIQIDLSQLAVNNGWTISNGTAYHDSCFAGYIKLKNIPVVPLQQYILEYEVTEYTTGSVNSIVGGVNGQVKSSLGEVTDIITVPDDPDNLLVQFYSNGTLGIKYMKIYPVLLNPNNGKILGFNVQENKWTTYYSGERENMLKFVNDFFAFQNGRLWKMNTNILRNHFFGTQYTSKLTVIVNASATEIKNYFSIRMKTNKPWSVPEITIPPSEGKSDGMSSQIKEGNFQILNNGDFFADILRDQTDPRFLTQIDALFNGALLQGSYAIFTFECKATSEVKLLSIDFAVSGQEDTY